MSEIPENRMESTFWIVWRIDGGAPTFKHYEESAAHAEAQRLARLNPGARFVVCEASRSYQIREFDVVDYDRNPDIPF